MPERGPRMWKEGPEIPLEETPEGMEKIPPAGTGPGMSMETVEAVQGIVLAGIHCRSRCWSARGSACRCSCGGENHGAMGKGGKLPTASSGGKPVQTLLWTIPERESMTSRACRTRESQKSPRREGAGYPRCQTRSNINKVEDQKESKSMGHEAPDLEKFLTGENADAIRKIEYLASPYWHPHREVRRARARAAEAAATELMGRNIAVFSPVVYSATIQERNGFSPPEGWYRFDLHFLAVAGGLTVLEVPGWKRSRGILVEMGFARALELPVSKMGWPEIRKLLELEQGTVQTLEHWQEGFEADRE